MANPLNSVRDYVRHSIAELKKVSWPSRELTIRFSTLVIIVSAAFAGFFATLDAGLQRVVNATFVSNAAQPVPVDVQPLLLDEEGNPINAELEGADEPETIQLEGGEEPPTENNEDVVLPPLE